MIDRVSRYTSQHLIALVVVAVVAVCVAVLAGASTAAFLFVIMCAVMLGAMVWMLTGGMSTRKRS